MLFTDEGALRRPEAFARVVANMKVIKEPGEFVTDCPEG